MKAVIVDLQGKYAAALDETGSVLRIPNAAYRIGQEIELHEVPQPLGGLCVSPTNPTPQ